MKRYIFLVFIMLLIFSGCGGGGGGDTTTGGGGNTGGGNTLPTAPAAQLSYADQKMSAGDYAGAKTAFDALKNNAQSTDTQKRQGAAGSLLCEVKTGSKELSGDDLIASLVLITNPATSSFSPLHAGTSEVTIPPDAYLLLGIAYMTRNKAGDNAKALDVMLKIGGSPFNQNFVFSSQIGMDVTNAEAHALLAMAYFYNDNQSGSSSQLSIARSLDPSASYQLVTEIGNAITVMGR